MLSALISSILSYPAMQLKASKHETHLKMRYLLRVVKDDDVDRS